MVLDLEWKQEVEEKPLLEEDQKVEKEYLLKLKMIKLTSLESNFEYKKLLKKKKINTDYFTIYFGKLSEKKQKNLNISFVMKKNIGNAVKRNKIKRKLKAAIQKILKEKQSLDLNYTYVIFGKNNVYKDKFPLIYHEVNDVFKRIKQMDK